MNERLRPEQVTFYHENGFLGPIDLLSQDEVAEIRRHVEEVETKLGAKMMSRFRIKAHLPFPFLCDLVSHPKLLDAVEDLIAIGHHFNSSYCWLSVKTRALLAEQHGLAGVSRTATASASKTGLIRS